MSGNFSVFTSVNRPNHRYQVMPRRDGAVQGMPVFKVARPTRLRPAPIARSSEHELLRSSARRHFRNRARSFTPEPGPARRLVIDSFFRRFLSQSFGDFRVKRVAFSFGG